MAVNGAIGHTGRRTQADRSAATRRALLDAARDLFGRDGFAATGREQIVEQAGVTRGALYHHFDSKEGLFRALYEELERELVDAVARAAVAGRTPVEQLRLGTLAYLDAAMDRAVQRVMLIDAPSVLGWEVRRSIAETYGLGLVRQGLEAAMAAGEIARQPLEPLAHLLLAALHEAALFVAQADDPIAARAEMGSTVERMLSRL